MNRDSDEHPHLLLWYVSGDMIPEQAREIEGHLRFCRECRTEAEALASMLQTLRNEGPASDHLRDRDDEARGRGASWMADRRAPARRAGWFFAATTGLALLALPAVWMAASAPPPEPSIQAVRSVTLSPPRRSQAGPATLTRTGPWAVTVELPLDAPEVDYRLRIEHEDGAAIAGLETTAWPDTEGNLSVVLQALPGPGRYMLVLEHPAVKPVGPYVYPFEVGAAPPPEGHPR